MSEHEAPMTPERVADDLDAAWDALSEEGMPASSSAARHPGGPIMPLVSAVTRLALIDDAPSPTPLFAARLRHELLGRSERPRSIERSTRALGFVPAGGRTALYRLIAAAAFAVLATGQLSGHGPLGRLTINAESPTVSAQTAVAPFVGTLVSCLTPPTPSGTSEAIPVGDNAPNRDWATQPASAADLGASCMRGDD